MNLRLADGTVRCATHFDASSYVSETSDPCTYCEEAHPHTIIVPVVLHNSNGDTIGAYQEGVDVSHVLDSLDAATQGPDSLWFGWSYVALV